MVILMSDDKPLNAMYGQKVKLDLDKLKNKRVVKTDEKVFKEPVAENKVPNPVVEETIDEKPAAIGEEKPLVEESVEEEVPEPVVDGEVADEDIGEEPVVEVDEEVPEPVVEETVEESGEEDVEEPKKQPKPKPSKLDEFKDKLDEKDKKLSNQSDELNYLTNKLIPDLKKENAELKNLKNELTRALEKSTRKYFDQLDINADLSNNIVKLGAERAVYKVKSDKFESKLANLKKDLESKISDLKAKLDETDIEKLLRIILSYLTKLTS